jgi:DNA-binding IclR family transcriptional regulator
MQQYKIRLRGELPKIYSQDLLNIIFSHPYSKIEFVVQGLEVTRITATRYLDEMTRIGLMSKQKLGRDNYYINIALFNLLGNVHEK